MKKCFLYKFQIVFFFLFNLLFISKSFVYAANYYVDQSGGLDINSGTATDQAWKTISKVNGSTFNPGDNIYFKRGETWREELIVSSSGASGNPITYSAYGSGDKPKIFGSSAVADWTDQDISESAGDLFSENFESTKPTNSGYDNAGWSETVGSGSVFDTDSTEVARPTGGGNQVLKIQKVASNYNALSSVNMTSDNPITYTTIYFRYNTYSLADQDLVSIAEMRDSAGTLAWRLYFKYSASAPNTRINLRYYNNGSDGNYSTDTTSIAADTWYKLEVKYDVTNKTYEWRIDGTAKGSGSLTGTLPLGCKNIKVGDFYISKTATYYVDKLNVNSGGYPLDALELPTNVWRADLATAPKQVWFGKSSVGYWGNPESSMDALDAEYDWYANSGRLYIYSTSDPDSIYEWVEATQRDTGVTGGSDNTKPYITINNLDIRYVAKHAIKTGLLTPEWTISNNDLSFVSLPHNAYADGIYVNGSNSTISGNTIHDAGDHGIYVLSNYASGTVENVVVENNTLYNCYHTGIDVMNLSGTLQNITVRNNKYYNNSNYDTTWTNRAILVSTGAGQIANGVNIYNNLIYNICDAGIQIGGTSGNERNINIYNNTVYERISTCSSGTWAYLIKNTMDAGTNNFKNNIGVSTLNTSGSNILNVEDSSKFSGFDNNIYYRVGGTGTYVATVNGSNYTTQSAYRTALNPKEASTLFTDPLFTNAGSYDFTLQSSSPAINIGADLSSLFTTDYAGTTRPQGAAFDVGAYEYVSTSAPAPVLTSIAISDSLGFTSDPTPTITIVSSSSPTHVAFSCNSGTNWSDWIAYNNTIDTFNILNGATGCSSSDGSKTITAKLKNSEGTESSTANDSTYYDTTSPTGGSVTYTDGYFTSTSVPLTVSDGSDGSGSGVNTSSRVVQRKSATLTGETCGSYGSFSTITPSGTYPNFTDTTVVSGNCYQYQYLVSDALGNQATYTSSNTAKVNSSTPGLTSITISDTSGFTSDPTPTITIVSSSSPTHVAFSCNSGTNWSGWIAYSGTISSFDITSGATGCSSTNESKTITAKLKNAAGTESSTASDSTYYDTTAPTGGSVTYTDGYFTSTSVPLTVSDGSDGSGSGVNTSSRIVQRKAATLTGETCGSYSSFETITTSGTYPNFVDTGVLSGYCYQYQYLVSDVLGNQATYTSSNTAKVYTSGPILTSITISDTLGFTSDPTPTITIVSSSSPTYVAFSCNGGTNWSDWIAYNNTIDTFNILNGATGCTSSDGSKAITAKLKNSLDIESSTAGDTTYYDTTSPTGGSVVYTDGYYTNTSIPLTVGDGSDGSGSGINTSSRIVQRKTATLTDGSCDSYGSFSTITPSGTYPDFTDTTVSTGNCYQYQYLVSDKIGNQATYTSENVAKVDTSGPTLTSISISDTSGFTSDPTPTITIVSSSSPTHVAFSCNGGTNWSDWIAYSDTIDTFNILNGATGCTSSNGSKTITAKLKNTLNVESSTADDSTYYDTTAPTSGYVTYTDGYYTTESVSITVDDGSDGSGSGINTSSRTIQRKSATLTNGVCGSYGSFSTITPSGTYPNFTDTTVSSGNCYQYQYLILDNIGNTATYTNSNVVNVDTSSPVLTSITISDSSGFTNDTTPTIAIVSASSPSHIAFSCNSGTNWSDWIAYSNSISSFDITNGATGCTGSDGTKTITAKLKNILEVESSTANDSTYYDTTAPSGGSITYTNGYYSSTSVPMTADDGSDGSGSDIDTSSRVFQRKSAALSNGTCGSYGSFSTITPSGTYPDFTDTGVSNGNCYQYQYLVSDNLSNEATYTSSNTAKVDTSGPTAPGTPSTSSATSDSTPTWTWTASTDTYSELATTPYTVAWSQDSNFSSGVSSDTSATNSYTHSSSLTDGTWYFRAKATDMVGNDSNWSSAGSFILNTSVPSTPEGSISINNGDTYTKSASVTLNISVSDSSYDSSQIDMKVSNLSDLSDASYEDFSSTKTWTLSSPTTEGTKTVYIRFKNPSDAESETYSDTITFDSTTPISFKLEKPSNNAYTKSNRPSFRWNVPSDAGDLSSFTFEIDNGDSDDFSISNIPVSGNGVTENSKYTATFNNFSDSDNTNNTITIKTKSSDSWSSDSENDGKLKEGKREWKVIAFDSAGNKRVESQNLFVDRHGPKILMDAVGTIKFSETTNKMTTVSTTDERPTFYGKIVDYLYGDKKSNGVASGPKSIDVKIEKKKDGGYERYITSTVVLNKMKWTKNGQKVTDHSQNISGKYSSFEYTPSKNLPAGTYKITLTGKDQVGNNGTEFSFNLVVKEFKDIVVTAPTSLSQINTDYVPVNSETKVSETLTKPVKLTGTVTETSAGTADSPSTEPTISTTTNEVTAEKSLDMTTVKINPVSVDTTAKRGFFGRIWDFILGVFGLR